jgi:hypothetical protein
MTDEVEITKTDNLHPVNDKNYIKYLETVIKDRDEKIFVLNEKLTYISDEIKSYDKLMGYTDEMSIRDKKKYNQIFNLGSGKKNNNKRTYISNIKSIKKK